MSRVRGSNQIISTDPSVRLVTITKNPVATLFVIWHCSRYEHYYDVEEIQELLDCKGVPDSRNYDLSPRIMKGSIRELAERVLSDYPEYSVGEEHPILSAKKAIIDIAKLCVKCDVPASESVSLSFMINDASVAWREQLVRGRLGQSYWTQTSRTADLSRMDVRIDKKIQEDPKAERIYHNAIDTIRNAYKALTELGIPTEDIRLAPECRLHRVTWTINFRSLAAIISKRSGWISQATLWSSIISQIMNILSYYNLLDMIEVKPPVDISDGKVVDYKYDNENMDRYTGKDPQPCDPLWLAWKGYSMPEHTNLGMYDDMKSKFIKLWSKEYCDVLGWDKDNPDKLGPYDRPIGKEEN